MRNVVWGIIGAVALGGLVWWALQGASSDGRRSARRARVEAAIDSSSRLPDELIAVERDPPPDLNARPKAAPRPKPSLPPPEPPAPAPPPPPEPAPPASAPESDEQRLTARLEDYFSAVEEGEASEWAEEAHHAIETAFQDQESQEVSLAELRCGGTKCWVRVQVGPDVDPEPALEVVWSQLEGLEQGLKLGDAIYNPAADDEIFLLVDEASP